MSTDQRLDSWKEIAAYLRRGVRTAQRWEAVAGLPVRRVASAGGAVYAFRAELDAWWERQQHGAVHAPMRDGTPGQEVSAVLPNARVDDGGPAAAAAHIRTFLSPSIAVDCASAAAHANLAVYFFTLVPLGLLPPDEGMPAARAAAQRAIDLDPGHADGLALAASVRAVHDYDWPAAGRRFARAVSGHAVSPAARFHYACWYLSPTQQHEAALGQLARALADDPLYLIGRTQVANEQLALGRTARGLAGLAQVLEIDPNFGPALGHLGREEAIRGRRRQALSLARRTHAAIPQHPNAIGFLAGMLRQAGDVEAGEALLDQLEHERPWVAPRARAEAHIVCGEVPAAVEWLGRAAALRDPGIWIVLSGSAGRLIRATDGWRRIRARLRMPEEPGAAS